MSNPFTFYTFLGLLACIIAGICCAWLLYSHSPTLTKPIRRSLAIVRSITIALLLWLLFAPLIRQLSYTLEKPVIVLAQDKSLSINNSPFKGIDSVGYQRALLELQSRLGERFQVLSYGFGESVTDGLNARYTDKITNVSMLSSRLKDELLHRNVGAIILATDGLFNRGGSPAADFAELRAPIYTIALGDTLPRKDLVLANVSSNELAHLGDNFQVEVLVRAYEAAGQSARLTVTENGKVLHEEKIHITDRTFIKNLNVMLKANTIGIHHYSIQLSPLGDEFSLSNNRAELVIEVIDDRQKILIAANGPHPDIAALRAAIGNSKRYEISVLTADRLKEVDPKSYGLIILHQLPGSAIAANSFLQKVTNSEMPLWYILGSQTDYTRLSQQQQIIAFTQQGNAIQFVSNKVNANQSVFNIGEVSRKVIEGYDPLQMVTAKPEAFGQLQVLINQQKGNVPGTDPLLFFANAGKRKYGFLLGEGIWKWKLSEATTDPATPVFNTLMTDIVQYLSVKDDKRKFLVKAAKQVFDENESVLINATLYNDSYVPVNTPDVTIQLTNDKRQSYQFSFSRLAATYQLDAGILPPGNYNYEAGTTLGNQKLVAKGAFFIHPVSAEYQQTAANHQLLYQLSAQSSGKMYQPDQLKQLTQELLKNKDIKTLSHEDRRYEALINFKWIAGILLLLLSIEWFLRKRNGMV